MMTTTQITAISRVISWYYKIVTGISRELKRENQNWLLAICDYVVKMPESDLFLRESSPTGFNHASTAAILAISAKRSNLGINVVKVPLFNELQISFSRFQSREMSVNSCDRKSTALIGGRFRRALISLTTATTAS